MDFVCAGFCGDEDGGAGAGAVFGGVGVGEDLELRNVVDRGEDADAARSELVVVDAVEEPISTVGAGATDGEREGTARGHFAVTARGEETVGIVFRSGAGGESGELNEIAAIQG